MQLWFWAAVAGMVLAGISNFGFKIAAKKGFDGDTFTFYGGVTSLLFALLGLLFVQPDDLSLSLLMIISLLSGFISSQTNLFKVLALRYIDATLFFPLFKIASPMLAVVFGIVFFGEYFTLVQWIGIILGHLIPLLLINRVEKERQHNLLRGLVLVLLVSVTSATAAALNKFVMDAGMNEWTVLWYTSWGITIGCLVLLMGKLRSLPYQHIVQHSSLDLIKTAIFRSLLICLSLLCVLFAYGNGGDLGIVQTIQGFYIVIPILLSVLLYQEHINWQKFIAVVLCILSLLLLA